MNVINTPDAPAAIGPYAQARAFNGLLFVSGQLPIDPRSGKIETSDPVAQMQACLANIEAIARAAGADLSRVVKTTVLVTDLSRFPDLNAAYAKAFSAPYPARATYEVSALPMGAQVEIEAVIALPE